MYDDTRAAVTQSSDPGRLVPTAWIYEILDRVDGRSQSARFGATQGRKVRDRIAANRPISPEHLARLIGHYVKASPRNFGLSEGDRAKLVALTATLPNLAGPLSHFVECLRQADGDFGDWIRRVELAGLAERFDIVSERLSVPVEAKNVEEVRTILLGSNQLSDDDWVCPSGNTDMRVELVRAGAWSEVETILVRLQHNVIMSFMSLWDIAYCKSRFPNFQLAPTFLFVAPRIRPDMQSQLNTGVGIELSCFGNGRIRQMIDVPFSLLFDFVSVFLFHAENKIFPDKKISLKEMSAMFGESANKLDRLRSGTDRVTLSTFVGLFRGYKSKTLNNPNNLDKMDMSYAFAPILFAAHTWTLCLFPRTEPGEWKAMIPDGTYRRFWNAHRMALQAREFTLEGGTTPWPEYLARQEIRT